MTGTLISSRHLVRLLSTTDLGIHLSPFLNTLRTFSYMKWFIYPNIGFHIFFCPPPPPRYTPRSMHV
jgi:hypothetical protein